MCVCVCVCDEWWWVGSRFVPWPSCRRACARWGGGWGVEACRDDRWRGVAPRLRPRRPQLATSLPLHPPPHSLKPQTKKKLVKNYKNSSVLKRVLVRLVMCVSKNGFGNENIGTWKWIKWHCNGQVECSSLPILYGTVKTNILKPRNKRRYIYQIIPASIVIYYIIHSVPASFKCSNQ